MIGRHRILSMPVRVHWAGFESDTYRLQRAGWDLSADQDINRMTMQLAIRNKATGAVAISEPVPWQYLELMDPGFTHRGMDLRIELRHFGRPGSIQFQGLGTLGPSNFAAIDAEPRHVEVKSLEDYVHFAPARKLIVPEETVGDLLARIEALQEPGRQAELERQVRENRGKGLIIKPHAQLISLAA